MATTYTLTINSISTIDETNVDGDINLDSIGHVVWTKTATNDAGQTASLKGETFLTSKNTSASNFIAFSSLTNEQVKTFLQIAEAEADPFRNLYLDDLLRKQSMQARDFPWG